MTNTPAPNAVATIPVDPSVTLDLSNPSAVVGAAAEQVQYTGTFKLGPHDWPAIHKMSALDMVLIQEAQDSKDFRKLIEAIARLTLKTHRQQFLDFMLSDPDEEDEKITLDDILEAMGDAVEQVNARPTAK